ncbi:MAG: TerD family protein [Thermoguttaceae bacterium]|nr:TerD family protein [Thermoguttaceae bacterium]MBQ6828058.1 TerD family protein [Thermoguttaceae bacterium]
MTVSLVKGQNIPLAPQTTQVSVNLAWDPRVGVGADFDLDAVCFMLDATGKTRDDSDFVYYHQLSSLCGAVKHLGDDPSGDAGEKIQVNLARLSNDIQKLAFAVSIYDAEKRGQNFGMARNARIVLVDSQTERSIAGFDLSEDACLETALVFGELYRYNGGWKFRALGERFAGGLKAVVHHFGLETTE